MYHYMVDIVVRLVRMPADTAESCWLCYFCIVKHLCSGDKEDDILIILHFYDLSINLLSHKTTRLISLEDYIVFVIMIRLKQKQIN